MEVVNSVLHYIGLGAQSFEHANILSEKINFSALGGPKVAIFEEMTLTHYIFKNMVWSQFFAVLSLFLTVEVA